MNNNEKFIKKTGWFYKKNDKKFVVICSIFLNTFILVKIIDISHPSVMQAIILNMKT